MVTGQNIIEEGPIKLCLLKDLLDAGVVLPPSHAGSDRHDVFHPEETAPFTLKFDGRSRPGRLPRSSHVRLTIGPEIPAP